MKITYHNEKTVDETDTALPLLAISLKNGIQHIHVCGGNARCSTCRVMVTDGLCNLSPRNEKEETLCARKGLDPNVRLACPDRIPCGDVTIRRLVHDEQDIDFAFGRGAAGNPAARRRLRSCSPTSATSRRWRRSSFLTMSFTCSRRYFRVAGEAVLQQRGIHRQIHRRWNCLRDGRCSGWMIRIHFCRRRAWGAIRAGRLEIQSRTRARSMSTYERTLDLRILRRGGDSFSG